MLLSRRHDGFCVLLGDPPIDWTTVHGPDDHRKWIGMREIFPADLIRREVLAKERRALLVFGLMHFQRKNAAANFESDGPAASIVSLLEERGGPKVFSIVGPIPRGKWATWWRTPAIPSSTSR